MSQSPGSDAPEFIDGLLRVARFMWGASDVHVEPTAEGYEVRFRIDGLLATVERLPADAGRSAVLRLMVLAQLLTYRLDIPQEGRIHLENVKSEQNSIDLRLAIIPVAYGLRAVVRLPAELSQPRRLEDLGLPAASVRLLKEFAGTDSGMLLLTGPAGSGKTTTIYALLEYIAVHNPGLSIISLEDPIERLLPHVTQIEVTPHGQMTYERALKSILRQDPQVLMLGEIRDADTATLAVQTALSGHRLIATMHAGDPGTAIARLVEMNIEPYQITSSIYGVVTQRLLRRKSGEGYKGRIPVAECAQFDADMRQAVLRRADADELRMILRRQAGHMMIAAAAEALIALGVTDATEVSRVLGKPI